MISIEKRLKELGIELPEPAKPSFDYVPAVEHDNILYISGQLPKVDGEVKIKGKVGDDVSIEDAQESARICILQGLSCIQQKVGDLNKIDRVLKIVGYINSAPDFYKQPKVLDAASNLLYDILGEKGVHSRVAIGAVALPRNTPVEIEMTVALKKDRIKND